MKVVFVLDHVRTHYLRTVNGGTVIDYFATKAGADMWNSLVEKAQLKGTDLSKVNFYVEFAYDSIPLIIKENKNPEYNKYRAPNLTQCKETFPRLIQKIEQLEPDLIVPLGGLGCKALLNQNKITALRGKPTKVAVGNLKETWVLPTFSQENVSVNRNNVKLQDIDFGLLMDYLTVGEETFIPKRVNYTTLYNTDEDFEKVIGFIDQAMNEHGKTPDDPIAWDYETNTLRAEYDNSAIISMSISFAHGSGITFPFEHPEAPWRPEQLVAIRNKFFEFLQSDCYTVGANIQFDIRFSKFHSPLGYLKVNRALDIQVAYYLAISQEELDSSGLKTLAYQYTDMGGYDEPVELFKKFFPRLLKSLYNLRKVKAKESPQVGLERFNNLMNFTTGKDMFDYLASSDYEKAQKAGKELKWQEYMNDSDMKQTITTAFNLMAKVDKPEDVCNPVDGEKFTYAWIPYRLLAEYASGDVDATLRIAKHLWKDHISKYDKWVRLYTEHYPRLMNTLADVEVNGMQVDEARLLEIRDAFEAKRIEIYDKLEKEPIVQRLVAHKEELYMQGLEEKAKPPAERDKEIYKLYEKYRKPESRKLSITSPYDKSMLMFGLTGYQLPATRETLKDKAFKDLKDGIIKESELQYVDFKTGGDNVELLLEKHPDFHLGKVLMEYQKAEKLVTTYTQSILDKADSKGVLHGNLVSTRTATSRLASRSPNLQNFPRHIGDPRRYDYEYPIKSYFVPLKDKGHDTLVQLDYSAQELRVTALVAEDEEMIQAFLDGKDIHKETASIAFDVDVEDVTGDMRSNAKAVSFGLIYG